jgi:hypothetical protein
VKRIITPPTANAPPANGASARDAKRRGPGRPIPVDVEAKIVAMIADGSSNAEITAATGVAPATILRRRGPRDARVSGAEAIVSSAVPQVIGALRHLVAGSGLTERELAARLGVDSCERLLAQLIALGVVRQSSDNPPKYGVRKDWL